MAEVAKGIIDIEINTGSAASQLQALQSQINAFNLALNKSNKAQGTFAAEYSKELQGAINKTGLFTAETVRLSTAAATLDKTLSKGKTSLGQFFSAKFNKDSAIAAETMALAAERAKRLQTQFIATSGAAGGFQEAIAVRPLAAFSSEAAVAAQRTQILSNMFKQGTTQLINFGKNVQWAGRQLMVGFTVPLTIFGGVAGKTFMELEKQVVGFKKVYGDMFTTPAELEKNLEAIKGLAGEYTKYGIAVKDTIGLAAEAAAAGRQGTELTDAVTQATRLATLGQMDQNAALETTISLQSAFKLSGQDLADTINFLNMVENQTVVTLQDIANAIPRVAPVISGLGGDVKDLTVFLAAMQEGGVNANEGANALKSGLASLINPTKQATAMLSGFGINLDAIIQANKGDLMGTVTAFSQALAGLDQFSRQQALEQVFGKFQYAKLGALFDNITRKGSQAQQVIATLGYTTEQLGATADKELKTIEESFGVQLTGAVERFKLAMAPIGQLFVQLAIPVVNFITKIVDGFNSLSDGQKRFAAIATVIVGVVVPAVTMLAGLFLNLVGTLAKMTQGMALFSKGFITGGPIGAFRALTQSSKYLSLAEIDAAMAAQQLSGANQVLNTTLIQQVGTANAAAAAIANLTKAYSAMIATQGAAGGLPAFGIASAAGTNAAKGTNVRIRGLRRNSGGGVPGVGNTDTVPAMLTPGEFVINKEATRQNLGLLKAINDGKTQGLNKGGMASGVQYLNRGAIVSQARSILDIVKRGGMGSLDDFISNAKDPKLASFLQRYASISRAGSAKPSQIGSVSKTFAHMDANTMNAKTPEGKQFFNNLYKTLLDSGALVGHQKTTWAYGQANGWNGWRVTGGTGFNLSKQTLAQGKTISINSKLNTKEGIPANVLLDDLVQNFSKGGRDNPYLPMLKRAGIKDNGLIEKISQKIHSDVIKNLSGLGQKTITDQKIYPDMTRIIRDSIGSTVKDGQLKEKALNNLSAGLQVRTGNVPKFKDPDQLKGTQYSFQALLKRAKESGTDISDFMPFFLQRNKGGEIPGSGNSDTVPTMLTPGEFVVNKKAASQNQGILEMINGGKVQGYNKGGLIQGEDGRFRRPSGQFASAAEIAKFQKGTISSRVGKVATSGIGKFAGTMVGGAVGYSAGTALTGGSSLGGIAGSLVAQVLPKAITSAAAAIGVSTAAFVGVAAPLALAGFAIYKFNKQIDDAEKSGAEFTKAMYGTSKTIEGIAEQFGTQTNAQAARIAAVERAGGQEIGQEAQAQSAQFVQSEAGQQMIKDIGTVKAGGGNAVEALRNQLSAAIISGAIGTEEARAIAAEVGTAIGDQSIAVDVSGELTKLMGPDGGDLLKNLSSITAEISPKIDANKLASDATSAYEKMNVGAKFVQLFQGGESDFIENYKLNEVSAANSSAFAKEAQARELLNLAYQEGTITLKEFQEQSAAITQGSALNQDLAAQVLGFQSQSELVAAAGQITTKKTVGVKGGVLETKVGSPEQLQAEALLAAQKKEVEDFLTSLPGQTEDSVAKISETIGKLGAGAFGDFLSGKVKLDDIPILVRLDEQGLGEKELADVNNKLQALRKIPDLNTIINVNTTSQAEINQLYDAMAKFDEMPDKELNIYAKDNFTGIIQQAGATYDQFLALPDIEKRLVMVKMEALVSVRADLKNVQLDAGARRDYAAQVSELMQSITGSFTAGAGSGGDTGEGFGDGSGGGSGKQTLAQYIKEFRAATKAKMDYFKATNHLLGTEKQEALALIDTAMYLKANKKQRAELIKLAEKQLNIQRATAFLSMTAEEKTLLSLSMQEKALDKISQKEEKALRAKQRQTELNNRALEDLAEKEDAVNEAYDARFEALDKVSEANDRIAEQDRSRISLASALASGDIAAAANAASEMQQQNAQYQIEDTRAALEEQRKKDIESLTVSVNGKLMTRNELEAANKAIQEEVEVIQDRMFNLETERLTLAEKRADAELRTFLLQQKQTIEALKLKDINGELTKVQKGYLKTLMVDFKNLSGVDYNQYKKYGGSIAKMAFGGVAYKGSTESPPALRMQYGSTVPGIGMTDKVPALLTPGEFVVRKSVAKQYGGFLNQLNGQVFPGIGGQNTVPTNNFLDGIGSPRYSIPESSISDIPVNSTNVVSTSSPMYNSTYNVNVNVSGTNASPDDIANVVMAKLSQQNRGNLRSSRY